VPNEPYEDSPKNCLLLGWFNGTKGLWINVRTKPSLKSKEIYALTEDNVVCVTGRYGDWLLVEFTDSSEKSHIGWVYEKLLKLEEASKK
jgi:uncharacterized protein YgiM (DUF1202 family)